MRKDKDAWFQGKNVDAMIQENRWIKQTLL